MDDQTFRAHVRDTLRRIGDAVDALPTDAVDLDIGEGVLAFDFEEGEPWVLSQQVPVRELWLAADRRAWHFLPEQGRWRERESGEALEVILGRLLAARLGLPVDLRG